MMEFIKLFIIKVFSTLPDSPFTNALYAMDVDFMSALNWFLPIDIVADMTLVWLACILLYYVFMFIWGFVRDFIKSKAVQFIISLFI